MEPWAGALRKEEKMDRKLWHAMIAYVLKRRSTGEICRRDSERKETNYLIIYVFKAYCDVGRIFYRISTIYRNIYSCTNRMVEYFVKI